MDRADKLVEQMANAIERGRPQITISLASSLLAAEQNDSVQHLCGVAYAMLDQLPQAELELQKAYAAEPGEVKYATDLANVLSRQGKAAPALQAWENALKLCSDDIGLWHHLAEAHLALGNMDAAADAYRRALSLEPEHLALWCNLAAVLKRAGDLNAALEAWEKAARLGPGNAQVFSGLGAIHLELEQFERAQRFLEKACELTPEALEPRVNLILVALGQLRFNDALGLWESYLDDWKTSVVAKEIHASILDGLGRECLLAADFDKAEVYFRDALRENPSSSSAGFNLGQVLRVHGDWKAAIAAYEHAASCAENDIAAQVAAWLTLPILYETDQEVVEVRQNYRHGLHELVTTFAPDTLDELSLATSVCTSRTNFQLAYQQADDLELQKEYGNWVSEVLGRQFGGIEPDKVSAGQRCRVGFVSSYWWRHTVGKLFRGWVEQIDSSQFEITVYHLGTTQDQVTQSLALAADTYVNIQGLPAQVKRIREDALDVLIYPEIGMEGATMALAALRLAPVQCVAWGHPVTTGLPTVDYFLTSDAMEPEGGSDSYSEELVRLPGLSIFYDRPDLPDLVRTRDDFGLPQDKVLYLCCQSLFKYLPENDEVWVQIANAVSDAHFVFINNKSSQLTGRFKERLGRCFQNSGLRLDDCSTFVGPLAFEDYLQLNGLCDIYLDSIGWSGGNTSLEALAWGVPMVTLEGEWMRGRHTSAILHAMDMGEWVAQDRPGYVERAILLGKDCTRRAEVHRTLMQRSEQIYSDNRPVQALEAFLREVSTQE